MHISRRVFSTRRLLEANDRLKLEVKRLKEAADEKEKDALQGDQARSKRAGVQTEECFLFLNSRFMFSRPAPGSGASDQTRQCEWSPERVGPCPSSKRSFLHSRATKVRAG